jgi:hypothetical protein
MKFKLDALWFSRRKEYPVMSAKVVKIPLQFSTSYLREQAFSCILKANKKSSVFCPGRTAGMFVKNSAKNLKFVRNETSSSITLRVNFTTTSDVSFIWMFKFNFILTYFDLPKGKIR